MGHGPGNVQSYILHFLEVATDAGAWAVARPSVVLARGAGLSAREGAQQYVKNWRDLLDISDSQRWHIESAMRAIRIQPKVSVATIQALVRDSTFEPWDADLESRVLEILTRKTTLELGSSDLQRSQKESTMRAIRTLVRSGRLEADGRAGLVSIAGMNSAYEAAVASARPNLERYITRHGHFLPPYVQEQYGQELHDAFRASGDRLRAAAQRR